MRLGGVGSVVVVVGAGVSILTSPMEGVVVVVVDWQHENSEQVPLQNVAPLDSLSAGQETSAQVLLFVVVVVTVWQH